VTGFVRLSVFASLSVGWRIKKKLVKFCGGVDSGPGTQQSYFGGDLVHDPNPGFLNRGPDEHMLHRARSVR